MSTRVSEFRTQGTKKRDKDVYENYNFEVTGKNKT
jgi:hypothetical protein